MLPTIFAIVPALGPKPSSADIAVLTSLLDGTYPTWFTDSYENDHLPYETSDDDKYQRNYDLEKLHSDVIALDHTSELAAIFQFKTAFGGYCGGEHEASSRNPWRAGGCLPRAPNAAVGGDGVGSITVRWEEPEYDGGSAITKYQVEWRSPGQDFDPARSVDLDWSVGEYQLSSLALGSAVAGQCPQRQRQGRGLALGRCWDA